MAAEIITKEDLIEFRIGLINEIKSLLRQDPVNTPTWLRSKEVCKLLTLSPSTLQNMRINHAIPYSKIGNTFYYKYEDIFNLLEKKIQS